MNSYDAFCYTRPQRTAMAMAAGAMVEFSGMDSVLPLPREAHYALAGMAVDIGCRGMDPFIETGLSAVMGVAGAMLLQTLMQR